MVEQRSRLRHPKYKTSLCKDFPLGKCTFGDRCNFAHSPNELRITLTGENPPATQSTQALIQTPVTVLPDGRMLSTFTPVPGKPTLNATKGTQASAPLKSLRRVAGDLRRNQSMGTLRAGGRPPNGLSGKVSLANLKDIANVTLATINPPSTKPVAVSPTTATHRKTQVSSQQVSPRTVQQTQARPPNIPLPAPPVNTVIQSQQVHYLQQQEQGNVARRVASLSHLPTLRSSPSQTFGPVVSAAANSSISSRPPGFLLGGNQNGAPFVSHMHTSNLTQIPSSQYSPALSSASFRDFDEAVTPGAQLDTATLNSEWLRAHNPHNYQPSVQQPQQQLLKSSQNRSLTSSISMQTLPRFKLPTNWEQSHIGAPTVSASGISTSQFSMSSQNSAATLIDSDVWSSSSYSGFGSELSNKPQDSRFFPATAAATNPANGLGSYYGTRTHPHSQYQQQLRRQQSTDDWVSMRNAYVLSTNTSSNQGHLLDMKTSSWGVPGGNGTSDVRTSPLDSIRAEAANRKQGFKPTTFNPMLCL
ncbi:hypothetical protein LPJ73_000085 [Coemansia sp. RSA 2703]|nr:hypothetical protein LPJ73_000085 [Coemansia sp. RSA 2703]KAJ2379591.1 hypothetical protein IW150_000041 [Coemansia sp. RSA 2607]KAJ2398485.1 hypothetical protein GGI05_000041 [Coemansia sp. RSA 2603]